MTLTISLWCDNYINEYILFKCKMCEFYLKMYISKYTLEKTEGEINNGQSRETGNIRYIRHRT